MDRRLRELERAFDNDPSLERMAELQRMYRLHGRFMRCMPLCEAVHGKHEHPNTPLCHHADNDQAAAHTLQDDPELTRLLPVPDQLNGIVVQVCSRCGGTHRRFEKSQSSPSAYRRFWESLARNMLQDRRGDR